MTKLSRVDVIRLLAVGVLLILPAASGAQQLPPLAEQMAKTYGLDSFGQVEAIRYTFNVEGLNIEGLHSRTWEWEPKTDTVSYEGKDKGGKPLKGRYRRSELSSQSDAVKNEIDPAFVSDQYWLLLPLHVAWDGASVTDEGIHETPLGKTSAERIVVKYASEGGYSPGDTWELYVGSDKRIAVVSYHRAVPVAGHASVVNATWEGHKKAGSLLIATEHHATADGKPFQFSFSHVSVKVTGSENWISVQ